jgi:hypothetical protein
MLGLLEGWNSGYDLMKNYVLTGKTGMSKPMIGVGHIRDYFRKGRDVLRGLKGRDHPPTLPASRRKKTDAS